MRRTLRADRINSRPVARQRGHAIQLQVSPASRDGCPLCFWRIQYGSPYRGFIQNVLEIDRKVLIARVLLFLLALIIGRHTTSSIDYSSATKPDAFTTGPQRSRSARTVAANWSGG